MNAVDTNVLLYGLDRRDPRKHAVAIKVIDELSEGVLLWQVACEFLSKARKLQMTDEQMWAFLDRVRLVHPIVEPTERTLTRARGLIVSHQLQFWDALIYAAALDAGVTRIYSEDLPGQNVPGLVVVNPFA